MPSLLVKGFVAALAIASGLGHQTKQWDCPENQQAIPVIYENQKGTQQLLQACMEFDEHGNRFLSYPATAQVNPNARGLALRDNKGSDYLYLIENAPGR